MGLIRQLTSVPMAWTNIYYKKKKKTKYYSIINPVVVNLHQYNHYHHHWSFNHQGSRTLVVLCIILSSFYAFFFGGGCFPLFKYGHNKSGQFTTTMLSCLWQNTWHFDLLNDSINLWKHYSGLIIITSFILYFSNRHHFLKEIKSPSFSSSFTSDQLWFRSPVGSSFSASYCHSCHFWLLISRVKLREKKVFLPCSHLLLMGHGKAMGNFSGLRAQPFFSGLHLVPALVQRSTKVEPNQNKSVSCHLWAMINNNRLLLQYFHRLSNGSCWFFLLESQHYGQGGGIFIFFIFPSLHQVYQPTLGTKPPRFHHLFLLALLLITMTAIQHQ